MLVCVFAGAVLRGGGDGVTEQPQQQQQPSHHPPVWSPTAELWDM